MDLLANDLSVHTQFHDLAAFRDALSRLMTLRQTAKRLGREIQCDRTFLNKNPLPGMPMQQAVGRLGVESEQRAVMSWLTRAGPFWDDGRRHSKDDFLEYKGAVVTDTAVGEAAFRTMGGVKCGLISLSPSDWNVAPLEVTWRRETEGLEDRCATLDNWWSAAALEEALQDKEPPLRSWKDVGEVSARRFGKLTFAENWLKPLVEGVPFAKPAADQFIALLDILNRLASAFAEGRRTQEGHWLYQDHFTGGNAHFSDSSDSEKQKFRQKLTFVHPSEPENTLFCPYHGKAKAGRTLHLRLHFSWPIEADKRVYVVYAGPKITKQ